jgi:V/A-type H+-transporting ATPase subunit E
MNGLDKITDRILTDAKDKARRILEEAQNDCRQAAQDYADKADAIRDRIATRTMQEGEALIARARSSAAMTRRDILIATKAKLLNEAFEAAKAQICDTDYGKYRELLVALLSCALLEQAQNEQTSLELGDEIEEFEVFEVLMSKADKERFGTAVLEGARKVTERRIGSARTEKLRLSEEDADIEGGLILRYGNVETNCSISALLAGMRRELEPKISAILFD